MGRLLRWALIYVEQFSSDILAAYQQKLEVEDLLSVKVITECNKDEERARLLAYIDRLRQLRRGLPSRATNAPGPNLTLIAKAIGRNNPTSLTKFADIINDAVAELGLSKEAYTVQMTPIGPARISVARELLQCIPANGRVSPPYIGLLYHLRLSIWDAR